MLFSIYSPLTCRSTSLPTIANFWMHTIGLTHFPLLPYLDLILKVRLSFYFKTLKNYIVSSLLSIYKFRLLKSTLHHVMKVSSVWFVRQSWHIIFSLKINKYFIYLQMYLNWCRVINKEQKYVVSFTYWLYYNSHFKKKRMFVSDETTNWTDMF